MGENDQCPSVSDNDRCEKREGHAGKHASFHNQSGEIQFVMWTNAAAQHVVDEVRIKPAG